MRMSEFENLGKLNEINPDLINMAVNLGMMTGCNACGNIADQQKCSFFVLSSRTRKCFSLRFGEYCDHLKAQDLARHN